VRLALSLPAHPPRSFEVAETAGGSRRKSSEPKHLSGMVAWSVSWDVTMGFTNSQPTVKGHVVDHQRSTWPSSGQWLPWWVPSQPPPLLGTVCWLILFGLGRFPGP
ncbi:unnamed protein product, partial [Durusdinium trenchii]